MEHPSSSPTVYRAGTLTYTKGALAVLFFWLLWGDFCFVLMESVVPSIMPLRFKALGAHNTTMALALTSIPGVINMICNPIISFKSDRFRSRWGRRIPFIFVTIPFLVFCVLGLAFSVPIGDWIHRTFSAYLGEYSPATVAIFTMSALLTGFSFFNSFVNSVFWYLFNDVVPEILLARFMSWFRVVSMGAGSLYSFVIFQYAGTHFREIFIGAGVLYFFGFGLMCLMVREGQYPPAPKYVDGQSGPVAAIKTFASESFTHRHYWFIFLANMGQWGVGTAGMFGIFFQQSMGLTLAQIGDLGGVGALSGTAAIVASGWLADKFHPIRIVIAGWILQVIVAPVGLIWLYIHPSPEGYFHFSLVWTIVISAPLGAMVSMMDPPLLMRIFPRDRYGQYCSANSMCRSVAQILVGPLAGLYLDALTNNYGADIAYKLLPLWNLTGHCLVLYAYLKLFGSWKSHGGDDNYMPPLSEPGIMVSDSLPQIPLPGP